ncbi:hypothetical protein JYU34_020025 [Plutella xylostella]|uniref:Mediator of RNA polymerase II transcription subunit 26 n=1 Tax=Plutella xylostella TaxID=51655 RepID=A0ABQ7PVZ3_PLUXY|nr:hypothetical protein JYU34_020025 [Plutella xylostella]
MSNNAHDLSKRLLNALDNSYNVVDMHAVNEIISILEKFNITKELLETTRLGKHVNELRRKTSDPTLARRAKVLVKRWRDLVIPAVNSPKQTALPGSNRSSAERQMRRLGGTPLTSPALALTRQVVSPAVNSPRPVSRPAWGGYESDSQDVILVDDDPPPPPPLVAPSPATPSKRPASPAPLADDKKAKRDKKPKKRRGHSRAGSGSEAAPAWGARNGSSPPPAPAAPPRKNGCRPAVHYTRNVHQMPPIGAKKVKTTKELLEEIQSRGNKPIGSPTSPGSPDVMLIEPEPCPIKVDSPLRNGGASPPPAPPPPEEPPAPPLPPLEDEREYQQCTCGEELDAACPAARDLEVSPLHVHALHHSYLPGINGTRAPLHPHQFAVRKLTDPEKPALFNSVVPLYMYSDYADDHCVKNMSRVPLCTHLPWTEFAPPPPSPPPPPPPPSPRPYPIDTLPPPEVKEEANGDGSSDEDPEEAKVEPMDLEESIASYKCTKIEAEMVGIAPLEPSERLKAPILTAEDEELVHAEPKCDVKMDVQSEFASEPQEHRTVERTKVVPKCDIDGRTLYSMCESARVGVPYSYEQASPAPVVTLPLEITDAADVLDLALQHADASTDRDEMSRPLRPDNFTEWHECARLGDLIALPYVVID